MANTDIPSFNDICGTVTQALAETIINRENLIAQLRDELAKTKDLLRERSTNYGELAKQNAELRNEIEGWRTECEIHERDEKELYRLREEIRSLKMENIRFTALRDDVRRTRRSDFVEQKSDSDPVTGVQYGDLT